MGFARLLVPSDGGVTRALPHARRAAILDKLDEVLRRMTALENKVTVIDTRLTALETRVTTLESVRVQDAAVDAERVVIHTAARYRVSADRLRRLHESMGFLPLATIAGRIQARRAAGHVVSDEMIQDVVLFVIDSYERAAGLPPWTQPSTI